MATDDVRMAYDNCMAIGTPMPSAATSVPATDGKGAGKVKECERQGRSISPRGHVRRPFALGEKCAVVSE